MKQMVLILMAVLSVGCARRGGGGGGGGGGGDVDDSPGALSGFVLDVDQEGSTALSAIYMEEELPGGLQRMVVATSGMTCAAYRAYWETVGPAYEQWYQDGDIEALTGALRDGIGALPGVPGWFGMMNIPAHLEAGDALENGVDITLTEFLDEPAEDPELLPYAIGRYASLSPPDVGELDALGSSARGGAAGVALWYGNYDPVGPSTSQDRDATLSFDAEHCELDDLVLEEP